MVKYMSIFIVIAFIVYVNAQNCNTVNCLVNPCQLELVKGCSAYPKARCVPNYCGGCSFDWFYNGVKVDCNAKCHSVACFLEPCRFAKCPAQPSAICKNNYCGGCFADFYINNKKVNC